MKNSKIWKIKGYEGTFSDEEIVYLIKKGKLKGTDSLSSKDIKSFVMIKDSIYQYYLRRNADETI